MSIITGILLMPLASSLCFHLFYSTLRPVTNMCYIIIPISYGLGSACLTSITIIHHKLGCIFRFCSGLSICDQKPQWECECECEVKNQPELHRNSRHKRIWTGLYLTVFVMYWDSISIRFRCHLQLRKTTKPFKVQSPSNSISQHPTSK